MFLKRRLFMGPHGLDLHGLTPMDRPKKAPALQILKDRREGTPPFTGLQRELQEPLQRAFLQASQQEQPEQPELPQEPLVLPRRVQGRVQGQLQPVFQPSAPQLVPPVFRPERLVFPQVQREQRALQRVSAHSPSGRQQRRRLQIGDSVSWCFCVFRSPGRFGGPD
jgi:hypothetical protein